jgi:hypothetical protein
MIKSYWVIIVFLLLQSCNKYDANGKLIKEYEELNKANWLIGDWEKKDSLGILKETWKTLDDSTYIGESYYIVPKNDTIHKETIQLMQDGEFLLYSTTVKGENNDEPITFQMTEDKDSLLVFENKKYNYPQKIKYQLHKDKTIMTTVSGKQNGKQSSENYKMTQIK